MLALVKTSKNSGLKLMDIPIPKTGKEDVLIKVKATSICGTDLHIYNWDSWAQKRVKQIPLVQGHEFCGEIVGTGTNVKNLKIGDFVSAESHIVNFNGGSFKKGLGHVAPETKIIGVDTNGCFAEYISIPHQNARKNPKKMPLSIAVLKENFGNAVHAAYEVKLLGKDVLITGCGPVGLMTIILAKYLGARKIFASDVSPYRLGIAKKLGADFVLNPLKDNLKDFALNKTKSIGVDVLFEMSGHKEAFTEGLASIKSAGDAIVFGLFPKPFEVDINNLIIFKGITVHGIIGRKMWDTWIKVENLLDNGKVDLSQIVTHTYKIKDYKKAFETMESGKSGKIMITF